MTWELKLRRKKDPEVSVIVVTYNGRQHLEVCLPALAATEGVIFETIVVDNGSTDGTASWLAEHWPEVRVLPMGRNAGFGAANGAGVEAAHGHFIALLNNDTRPEPGWLRPLVDVLRRDEGAGAACAELRLMEHPGLLNARGGGMTAAGFGFDRDFGMPVEEPADTAPRDVLFPTAAAMVMRREEFRAMGGFDPAFFMYHEDVELGWRLNLAGRRVLCCPRSVVYHRFGGTTLQSARGAAWRARLGACHLVRSLLVCYAAGRMVRALFRLHGLWLRTLQLHVMAAAWGWNLVRLPSTLRRRRAVQRTRTVRDAALLVRGLIDPRLFPAAPPDLPRRTADWYVEHGLVAPALRPGYDAAMGRLGPGWYPPETRKGRSGRRAAPGAQAWVKTQPGARGRLRIEAQANAGSAWIVRAGGHTAPCGHAGGDALTAEADARGLVQFSFHPADGGAGDLFVVSAAFETAGSAHPGSPATVSVIMPSYNRASLLVEVAAALAEQTVPPWEVIVVDDGSTDGAPDWLANWAAGRKLPYALRIERQANAGAAAARNRGLDLAEGDLVVFLGDDTVPAPDFIDEHLRAHGAREAPCAVVGYTDWDPRGMRVTPFLRFINRQGYQFGYGLMKDGDELPFTCYYTSNLSFPRAALGAERFDTAYRGAGWEDTELGYRLSLRGLPLVYHAAARTAHIHPMRMTDFCRRQRINGRNYHLLFARHAELARHPALPQARSADWFVNLGHFTVRWAMPIMSAWDGLKLPMPRLGYRAALMWSFYRGVHEAEAERATAPPP